MSSVNVTPTTLELVAAMQLQGRIRVLLMSNGVSEGKSDDLASEIMHLMLTSTVVTDAHRLDYESRLV